MILLVVDMQKGIVDDELYAYETFMERTVKLIDAARKNHVEVIYVQHDAGEGTGLSVGDEAFEIDDELYMAAYLQRCSRPATSCTIVLDLKMNLTTMIRSSMGTAVSARDIDQRVWHGVIRREGMMPPLAWRHHPTRDLVGLSTGWSYRDDMASQHIYGSPYGISWVILTGPGNGLLGSAPCKYFKIREHVYLYSWLETMGSGQQGVVLMNMKTMHDVGTFYGVNHAQRFEFYTYGAKGYILGRYSTRDKFL